MKPEEIRDLALWLRRFRATYYNPAGIENIDRAAAALDELCKAVFDVEFCCDGSDCGCRGRPIDPPLWWDEMQALRRDHERVEWLEENAALAQHENRDIAICWWRQPLTSEPQGVRDAVDAAMEEAPST